MENIKNKEIIDPPNNAEISLEQLAIICINKILDKARQAVELWEQKYFEQIDTIDVLYIATGQTINISFKLTQKPNSSCRNVFCNRITGAVRRNPANEYQEFKDTGITWLPKFDYIFVVSFPYQFIQDLGWTCQQEQSWTNPSELSTFNYNL